MSAPFRVVTGGGWTEWGDVEGFTLDEGSGLGVGGGVPGAGPGRRPTADRR